MGSTRGRLGRHNESHASVEMIPLRVLTVLPLLLLVACASSQATSPAHLRARLVAPADVRIGDSAELRLTVYNESSSETRLVLWAGGGVAFDPVVRQGNVTVWQRSVNRAIVSASQIVRLPPGDSLTFVAVWHLTDSEGRAVSPGVYDCIALLKDDDGHSIIGDGIRQVIRVSP